MRNLFLFSVSLFAVAAACGSAPEAAMPDAGAGEGVKPGPRHPGPCVVDSDVDGDGTFDRRASYTYDDQDRLTLEVSQLLAQPFLSAQKLIPYRITYGWHDERWLARQEIDDRDDGTVDRLWTYTLEGTEEAPVARGELDVGGDGTVQSVTVWSYERIGEGPAIRVLEIRRDDGPDGADDWVRRYTYDERFPDDALASLVEEDVDGNGVWDRTITVDYDDAGNLLGMRSVMGAGFLEWESVYDYGCFEE